VLSLLAEHRALVAQWGALKTWLYEDIPARDIAPLDRVDAAEIATREEVLAEMAHLERDRT
jgi:hypothetical protein